jgi:hypothetical protein
MTAIPEHLLSPKQLAKAERIRAKHVKNARIIPIIYILAGGQGTLLFLVVAFEISLFLEIFSYISDGQDSVISDKMLGLTGVIVLITSHIITIYYRDSKAIKFIHGMVLIMLPLYVLGVGFLFASGLSDSLMDLFANGDLEAEAPLLPGYFQEYILPNAGIIFVTGMCGFTAFCIFSASYLFSSLKDNFFKFNELKSNRDAANGYMNDITSLQSEHVNIYAQERAITERLTNLASETAHKIAMEVNHAVSILDGWIAHMELNPGTDKHAPNPFANVLDDDDDHIRAIKKMPLDVLKSYRDKLKSLDENAILAIIRDH